MKAIYKHTKANIYSHKTWLNSTTPETLKETYDTLLRKVGFTIVLFNEYHFQEHGYTCFWLLAESHLAIHTFPESGKSYLELSSCNKEKLDLFILKTSTA